MCMNASVSRVAEAMILSTLMALSSKVCACDRSSFRWSALLFARIHKQTQSHYNTHTQACNYLPL
jgi:hypothetical protein